MSHSDDLATLLRWLAGLEGADLFAGAITSADVSAAALRLAGELYRHGPPVGLAGATLETLRARLQPRRLQTQTRYVDVQSTVLLTARLKQGLTQLELGQLCGLSQGQISRAERGASRHELASEVAAALGIQDLRAATAALAARVTAAGIAITDRPDRAAHVGPDTLAALVAEVTP